MRAWQPARSTVTSQTAPDLPAPAPIVAEVRGTHAGFLVLIGVGSLNLGNAVFHLLSARLLGPGQYSDVVSLVAAQGLFTLPFGGVQYAIARSVAEDAGRGDADAVAAFVRRSVNATFVGAAMIAVVATALSPLIQHALGVGKLAAVVLTTVYIFPALLLPTFNGVAQGFQRFGLISASLTGSVVARIAFILALIPLGLGAGGVMAATAAAACVAIVVPLPLCWGWYRRGKTAARAISRGAVVRSVAPVIAGVLAITSLTTVDLIVAKVALSPHVAGVYGAASFVGRLLLYLPMTIATVLLPKITSRVAIAQDTAEIFHASLAITALFSLAGTAVLVAVPRLIVHLAFGSAYDQAVPLVGVFGIAMTLYAILNVQLVYHIGHGREEMAWLLLVAAALQIGVYALVHGSTYQLVFVNLGSGAVLVAVHELVYERTLPSAARWLVRRFRRAWAR
ncbi:MAG TPA: oligosaccharide flippase family protein [Gaiellaceae bacterium]|nr:oligosaccharide flippase family protein [Gaiellaceae bacterium]